MTLVVLVIIGHNIEDDHPVPIETRRAVNAAYHSGADVADELRHDGICGASFVVPTSQPARDALFDEVSENLLTPALEQGYDIESESAEILAYGNGFWDQIVQHCPKLRVLWSKIVGGPWSNV